MTLQLGALQFVLEQVHLLDYGGAPHNYSNKIPFQKELYETRHRKILQVGCVKNKYYLFPRRAASRRTFRGRLFRYNPHTVLSRRVYNHLNIFNIEIQSSRHRFEHTALYAFEDSDVFLIYMTHPVHLRIYAFKRERKVINTVLHGGYVHCKFMNYLKEGILWVPQNTST